MRPHASYSGQVTEPTTDRVIRTPEDAAAALVDMFMTNADAGDHEDNDRLIEAMLDHQRSRQRHRP